MIENVDQRAQGLRTIARDLYRPGHADYAYFAKYGVRDYRGGGRSSARETAARVAAGAVARKVLGDGVQIRAALVQIGPHAIDRARWDWTEVENNPFWCPTRQPPSSGKHCSTRRARPALPSAPSSRSRPTGVPAGWGAPVYGKLDAEIWPAP